MSRSAVREIPWRGRISAAQRGRLAAWGPRRRFATGAFAGQVMFSVIALGGTLVVARTLGPSGKGEFTTWALAAALGATVAAVSISTGFGRAYLKGLKVGLATRAMQHGAYAGAIVLPFAVTFAALGVVSPAAALMMVVAVPTGVATLDLLVVMQAAKWPWAFQATRICNAAVFTVGMVVFTWLLDGGLSAALLVWGAATLIPAAVAVSFILRGLPASEGSRPPGLMELQQLGGKAFIANLGDWFLLRLDQLMTALLLGPAALGIYSVAVNWSEISQYVGHSIGQSMFEDERTLRGDQIRRVLRATTLIVALAAVGTVVAGWVLIDPLFGSAFHDSRWALAILAPGVIARSLGFTASQILLARGLGNVASRIVAVAVAVGLAGWVVGGLTLGVEGIAVSSTLVYCIYAVLMVGRVLRDGGAGQGPTSASDEESVNAGI